jgi:DNA polymerase-3 subunit alpha
VLTVEATLEADQIKLLARGIEPIDSVVADAASTGFRVFVTEVDVLTPIANVLEQAKGGVNQRSKGPIHLMLMHPDLPGEVELSLKGNWPVTPQTKGALKSLTGVLEVEEF